MKRTSSFHLYLMITGILVFGLLVFWPAAVQAAEFRGGDVVIIKADEVIDDLEILFRRHYERRVSTSPMESD